MGAIGRSPEGACPRCGEHGGDPAAKGKIRCWNCEKIWQPRLATDGGVDVSKLPGKPRRGGDGLPVTPFGTRDGGRKVHLFTCCGCGHRWLDPPGPSAVCLCGGSIVVHQFTVDEYQRIKEFGDVREREPIADGGTEVDPTICARLRRIYRRGPSTEEVAGLFGFEVADTREHLVGDCECYNSEQPITTLGGRQ